MIGEVLLAGDRQLQSSGKTHSALFLVVWGGLFGGIPIALLLSGAKVEGARAVVVAFPLIGLSAFFYGLYLALQRTEVWFDPQFDRVEVRQSILGKVQRVLFARKLFDRVHLRVEIGEQDKRSYHIELLGPGEATVPLGEFPDRDDALVAGLRAARRVRVAFEEKPEGLMPLRIDADELMRIPAAELPQDQSWWQRPTTFALVVANLVPIWGVLHWGWHILPVMLLFWMENVVVGGFTILKMLIAMGGTGGSVGRILQAGANLFTCAFFAIHYGMFCAVHGIFVVFMFGGKELTQGFRGGLTELPGVVADLAGRNTLILALAALVASHGISFYMHYLKPRAYEEADARQIMGEPYKRVVILHVVILFGGIAAQATGSGVVPLLLLIALKTGVDLTSHKREHAMPHEREMRDFMAEHGHRYVRATAPAVSTAAVPPGGGTRS